MRNRTQRADSSSSKPGPERPGPPGHWGSALHEKKSHLAGWPLPSQRSFLDTEVSFTCSIIRSSIAQSLPPTTPIPDLAQSCSPWNSLSLEILPSQLKPTSLQSFLYSTSIHDALSPEQWPSTDTHITSSLTISGPLYARLYSGQLRYSRDVGVVSKLHYLSQKKKGGRGRIWNT